MSLQQGDLVAVKGIDGTISSLGYIYRQEDPENDALRKYSVYRVQTVIVRRGKLVITDKAESVAEFNIFSNAEALSQAGLLYDPYHELDKPGAWKGREV